MRKSIKRDGIFPFVDQEYPEQGGSTRLQELLELRWERQAIAEEFNITTEQLRKWIKQMVDEKLWNETKYGPAFLTPSSRTA